VNLYNEFYQNREKQLGITKIYINNVLEGTIFSCGAITMIITYNQLYGTENLYTQFYQNGGKYLGITKKYSNYDQEGIASYGAISMFITYNE
jgi:hypothetical protein